MIKRNSPGERSKKTFSLLTLTGLGITGWLIIFLALVIVVFIGSIFISPGKVEKVEQPLTTVTVQVLNGCGDNGAADALASALLPGDGSLMYDIIDKSDARLAAFAKTTVVDRRGAPSGGGQISSEAKRIAAHLGIDQKDVILLRLEENLLAIDVTVIAGKDYFKYVDRLKKAKEASL